MTHDNVFLASQRRGALLLVVLSMLILFLMLGTVLVTHATRSRTAATSFATAVSASTNSTRIANAVLDEALMQLIRGKPNPDTSDKNDESLLADKYSALPAVTGTATITSADILVTVTFTPAGNTWDIDNDGDGTTDRSATYLDAGGRILTFLPTLDQVGTKSSYRILRAEPADPTDPTSFPFTCYLENHRPELSATLPATGTPVEVILNNQEFPSAIAFAEPYDSFEQDAWLTQCSLSGTSATEPLRIERTAFQNAASPAPVVDNDGDGVLDSEWRTTAWKNTVFPNRTLPNGDTLAFDVSYLVYDLDSRFNVNAHGSLDYAKKAPNTWNSPSAWGTVPQAITDEQIEPGFGWGVADIHLPFTAGTDDRVLAQSISQGMASVTGTSASPAFFRETRLPSVDGRYGWGPGATANTPADSPSYDELQQRTAYNNNKLVDLKSLMMLFVDTTQTPPELNYRVPADYVSAANLLADPYELAIDGTVPRINAYGNGANSDANSLFSLSELERVLRQYDSDATTLPQRLANILVRRATDLRMLVTTDSWDTPALTGDTANRVLTYFAGLASNIPPDVLYEMVSPDIAGGMRFDINRPFDTSSAANLVTSKNAFCRHLYCLLIALGETDHQKIAQWVVNVLDYRDNDSRSTQFVYDTDLSDGWGDAGDNSGRGGGAGWAPTTNVIQGNEKTTLVIAETAAWWDNTPDGELFVMLYRPPADSISFPDGSTETLGQLEPILTGPNGDLDICKKNSLGDPIWRLRYVEPNGPVSYVRLDNTNPGSLNGVYNGGNTACQNSVSTLEVPADGFVVIYPGENANGVTFANQTPSFKLLPMGVGQGKKMGFVDTNSQNGCTVHLERLADPEAAFHASTNPYIDVNTFKAKAVAKNGFGVQNNGKSYRRCPYHFWSTPEQFVTQAGGSFAPL